MRAVTRSGDELCKIAGPGCPYTLPIAGRSLIAHAVRALCDAGVRTVLVAIDAAIAEYVAPAVEKVEGVAVEITIGPPHNVDGALLAMSLPRPDNLADMLRLAGDASHA